MNAVERRRQEWNRFMSFCFSYGVLQRVEKNTLNQKHSTATVKPSYFQKNVFERLAVRGLFKRLPLTETTLRHQDGVLPRG
jgi:hypothetical protein|tara:strand:- start:355 stop:597 length:243 start_codon:yes stop_codon:yes gene_type:complete